VENVGTSTFNVGVSTSQKDLPEMFHLVEHSYSHTEHVEGMPSADDQHDGLPIVEEEPVSRTSGLKYASCEEYSSYLDEDVAGKGVDVVVRLRKKRAPPITNRLIIPVLRVARSALTERNVSEDAANEVDNRPSSGEFVAACSCFRCGLQLRNFP